MGGLRGLPGKAGIPGRKGPRGAKGANGRPGMPGKKGKDGKDGKNGKHGKVGQPGKKGPDGKKGPKGDSCKSELQIHLNALKSYVDMKFDVLKGMMDKTLARTTEGSVELGEDEDTGLGDMETQLQQSMTSMAN